MSGASVPLSRPAGRALVVGGAACRSDPLAILERQGFPCAQADDVYAAMAEIAQQPLVYRAIVLGLSSLYREELEIIATIKRRYPHIEVWLSQSDGRQAALAESMRMGADGLLSEEGLHRIASAPQPVRLGGGSAAVSVVQTGTILTADADNGSPSSDEVGLGEPVLSVEELRALLSDQSPILPATHREEYRTPGSPASDET